MKRVSSVRPPARASIRIFASLCNQRAIDCGYAALACAIEGRAWERQRFINMMRRLGGLADQAKAFKGMKPEITEK
jgi:hypothetical protein